MARYSVKYRIGKEVKVGGIEGMITAIHIRGNGRSYEFSYTNKDNNPTCVTIEECEVEKQNKADFGFTKKD